MTSLLERPYDLRNAGITWRLNSEPAPDVAKWARSQRRMLTRIYAGCAVGLDEVWITRMSAGFRPGGLTGGEEQKPIQLVEGESGERGDRLGCAWGAATGGRWRAVSAPGGAADRSQNTFWLVIVGIA